MIRKPNIHIVLIIALGLIVYWNSLHVPFYFDDQTCIENNPAIKNFSYFTDHDRLARLPILQDIKNNFILRPVAYLSFAINYRLHGLDVFGFHVVNITIHIINAILVYLLLALIIRTPFFLENKSRSSVNAYGMLPIPLIAGLLFVSHPLQTQAVTYICQRFISLATLFCLSAIVLYATARFEILSPRRRVFYALSLVSTIMAMFTKETAFTLPLLLVLFEFVFFKKEKMQKRLLLLVPFILTMVIIPLNVINITHSAQKVENSNLVAKSMNLINFGSTSRWDYLMTQFGVITTYLRLLVFPVNQNLIYDYPLATSLFQPSVFLPLIFLLILFVTSLLLLYRAARDEREPAPYLRLAAFGVLWFFITLSVESSIIPIEDVIFEHRAYLPSIGIFLAASGMLQVMAVFCGMERCRRAICICLCLVIGIMSIATILRNRLWQDKTEFWRDVVTKSPLKSKPHGSLAGNLAKHGYYDEAEKEYSIAIRLQPGYLDAYIGLGNIALNQNRFGDAIAFFKTALLLNPDNHKIYGYLSDVFIDQGKLSEARSAINRGLELEPAMDNAHNNLGVIYEMEGKLNDALKEYKTELKLNPENNELRTKIINLSQKIGL